MSGEKSAQRGSARESAVRLQREYDQNFAVSDVYREILPDEHNATTEKIQGAPVPLMQVGISDFCVPVRMLTAEEESVALQIHVTGGVSLAADQKGINMSRLIRTFYDFKDRIFTLELLEEVLLRYKHELNSSRARLRLDFSYPIVQMSLRSGLEGYQYYDVALEGVIDDLDRFRKRIHFDFVYSSACPCAAELAEHARLSRERYAIGHSQRSKARVSVEVRSGSLLTIEDLRDICLEALKTETQVMVRREDEQAFAELNGANLKFVEDAARLVYEALAGDKRVVDFQIACAHLESLHSYNVVAVVTKGVSGGFSGNPDDFGTLRC